MQTTGDVLTQRFDASWHFTDASTRLDQPNGSELIQSFDTEWQLQGTDTITRKEDGAILTQHYDQSTNRGPSRLPTCGRPGRTGRC